jgi:hypothetical protein
MRNGWATSKGDDRRLARCFLWHGRPGGGGTDVGARMGNPDGWGIGRLGTTCFRRPEPTAAASLRSGWNELNGTELSGAAGP